MQTLRVGIWLDPNYKPTEGGGYSYYEKLVGNIDRYHFSSHIEIVFLTEVTIKSQFRKHLLHISIFNKYIKYDAFVRKCIPPLFKHFRKIRRIIETPYYHFLFRKLDIDVLYYLKQEECYISNYPFIATNWDIGHISTFPFPEIVKDFTRRKRFYEKILPKAIFVFCESESGKEEIKRYTSIDEFKLRVVPTFSGDDAASDIDDVFSASFLKKNELTKNKYYFYPAQFWAHKNHYGLLLAFSRIVLDYPDLKLVLTGSDKNNLNYVRDTISSLGINNNVLILGFVTVKELHVLYKNAVTLVMPTYLGPTNMPPIEAMELNCPVICSELSGHNEILGDAAFYFQPQNITSIEGEMRKILNPVARDELLRKLYIRNKESKFKVEFSVKKIEEYLLELSYIRKTWK
jgi:glycosyltransferase involved in cell wall biosynthesis